MKPKRRSRALALPLPRRVDRAGAVTATLLFALTGVVPLATLASGDGAPTDALFRATAILFASIAFLHIDSWVAAIAGARRPGTILVRCGVVALLAALGARSALAAAAPLAGPLVFAGLLFLGVGLFRWLRFALQLRGRTAPASEEGEAAAGGGATEVDLRELARRISGHVRERLKLDAVSLVAFDRGLAPLAEETAFAPGTDAGKVALPDVRDAAVAEDLREGRAYSDGFADEGGRSRERIAVPVMAGESPVGAILAATAPGKTIEGVDVLSLRSIAASVASPLAAAVALARLRRRTHRLRAVHGVCKELSLSLSTDELLSAAPRALVSALDHGRATICLRRAGSAAMCVVARSHGRLRGEDDAFLASLDFRRATSSPHAAQVRSGRRAACEASFFEGTTSLVIAPLHSAGETIGAAVVESTIPEGFTAEEVSAIETVGEFLAISLANARLYANERRTVQRLETVSESQRRFSACVAPLEIVTIAAETLRDGFGAARTDAVLFRFGTREPEAAATSSPGETGRASRGAPDDAIARAVETRASVLGEAGAVVVVPILAGGAAIGVLHLARADRSAFRDDEVRAIETVADAMAVAVEKARHVASLRERTDALAELRAAEALERARLAAILGRIPDAVIVLDAEGRVGLVNDAAARLLPAGLADGSGPLASRMSEGPLRRALEAASIARREGKCVPVEAEGEVSAVSGRRILRASVQDLPGSGGFIAVLRDVTEERELARGKERLFDDLTHDLRSPMTAILGFARMMRAGENGPVNEEQSECLARVVEQGERLLSLVDAQLDVVRLEGGAGRIDAAEVDVEKIVSEVTSGFAAAAQARGISLTREPVPEAEERAPIPKISGDARLVYRLFANLVGNAIKFTPERGAVRVAVRARARGVEVTVADSGIGISREDQGKLFGRFVRVGAPRGEASGHGLGLSIVKEIVEQHGGRIEVESEGERRGTLFRVSLPAVRRETAAPGGTAPRPRRVLVLDDGRNGGVAALRSALNGSGDTVRILSSGSRLGDEALSFRPHAILVTGDATAATLDAIASLAADARTRDIEVRNLA